MSHHTLAWLVPTTIAATITILAIVLTLTTPTRAARRRNNDR